MSKVCADDSPTQGGEIQKSLYCQNLLLLYLKILKRWWGEERARNPHPPKKRKEKEKSDQ